MKEKLNSKLKTFWLEKVSATQSWNELNPQAWCYIDGLTIEQAATQIGLDKDGWDCDKEETIFVFKNGSRISAVYKIHVEECKCKYCHCEKCEKEGKTECDCEE